MSKRLNVLLSMLLLLTIVCVSSAQDEPPVMTQIQIEPAAAAASPGQPVSCTATVSSSFGATYVPHPKIRISGWKSGSAVSNISWAVQDSAGGWSFNGSAKVTQGSAPRFHWEGDFWFWWGPFQRHSGPTGGMCKF